MLLSAACWLFKQRVRSTGYPAQLAYEEMCCMAIVCSGAK